MQHLAPLVRAAIAGTVLLASACAEAPTPQVAVLGDAAAIIGPDTGFDPAAPPADWFAGPGAGQSFAVVERAGLTALEVRRADTVIGRRVAVPLLAAPYLRWGWHLEPPAQDAGIRLVVGFARRGDPPAQSPRGDAERIEIALIGAAAGGARVTAAANGGPPVLLRNAGAGISSGWLVEAIDLAALHRQLRPGGAGADLDVVFVAVGGVGRRSDGRPLGQIAEVVLSR